MYDLEIRCTPYSQSAEIQLVFSGEFNFYQIPWNNYSRFEGWSHKIIIVVGEQGYKTDPDKQRIKYTTKLFTDGTSDLTAIFSIIAYPLHSLSEYEVDVYCQFVDALNNNDIQHFHSNFSTGFDRTAGVINSREPEITLQQKQTNAGYLHRQLVKTKKFSLESFCCLLGIMDAAGNLNPASNMCFGSFTESDALYHYNFTVPYNIITYNDTIVAADVVFGRYVYNPDNVVYKTWYFVDQNGITAINNNNYYSLYSQTFFNNWYYDNYYDLRAYYTEYSPEFAEKYKFAKAFSCIPIYHNYYMRSVYLYDHPVSNNTLDVYRQQTWLNVETVEKLMKRLLLVNSGSWWLIYDPEEEEFADLWQRYNTFVSFSKCRNTNIERLAEFMCYCFIGGTFGGLGMTTTLYFQSFREVEKMYDIARVKEKARYWYNYFKKRHIWWPYLRWTM